MSSYKNVCIYCIYYWYWDWTIREQLSKSIIKHSQKMYNKITNSLSKKHKCDNYYILLSLPTVITVYMKKLIARRHVSFHTLFCLSRLTPCCSFRYLRISRCPCLAAKKIGSSLFCKAHSFFLNNTATVVFQKPNKSHIYSIYYSMKLHVC